MKYRMGESRLRQSKQGYQFMRNMMIYNHSTSLDTIKRTAALMEAATDLLSIGHVSWRVLQDIPRPVGKATQEEIRDHRLLFLAEMEKRCYAALNALKGN